MVYTIVVALLRCFQLRIRQEIRATRMAVDAREEAKRTGGTTTRYW